MSMERKRRTGGNVGRAFVRKRIRAPRQLRVTENAIVRQETVTVRSPSPLPGTDTLARVKEHGGTVAEVGLSAPAPGQKPVHAQLAGASPMVLPKQTIRFDVRGDLWHQWGAAARQYGLTVYDKHGQAEKFYLPNPDPFEPNPILDYVRVRVSAPRSLVGDKLDEALRKLCLHPGSLRVQAEAQGKPNPSGTGGGEVKKRKGPRLPGYCSMRREEYEQALRAEDRAETRRLSRMWREIEELAGKSAREVYKEAAPAERDWRAALEASWEGISKVRALLRAGKRLELRPLLWRALQAHANLRESPPLAAVDAAGAAYRMVYNTALSRAARLGRAIVAAHVKS